MMEESSDEGVVVDIRCAEGRRSSGVRGGETEGVVDIVKDKTTKANWKAAVKAISRRKDRNFNLKNPSNSCFQNELMTPKTYPNQETRIGVSASWVNNTVTRYS